MSDGERKRRASTPSSVSRRGKRPKRPTAPPSRLSYDEPGAGVDRTVTSPGIKKKESSWFETTVQLPRSKRQRKPRTLLAYDDLGTGTDCKMSNNSGSKTTTEGANKKRKKQAHAASRSAVKQKRKEVAKAADGPKKIFWESTREFLDKHDSQCAVCGDGGTLALCSSCTLSFHQTCLEECLEATTSDNGKDFLPSDDKEEKWHCACCIVEFRGNRLPRDEDHHVAQQIEQKKEAASSKNQQQRTFLVGSKKMGDPTFSEETAEDEASEEETSYDDEISHSEYETSDDEEASDVDLDHTLFETDHVATNSDDGVVDVAINEVFDEQQAASWRMPKGLGGLCHDTITWMMPTWLQELLCDVGGHAIAMWIGSELLYKRPPLYQMEPVYVLLSFLHFLLAYACHYSWDKYAVCHPVIKVTAAQFVLYSLLVVWLESPDGHTWSSTGIKLWRRASEAVSVTALVLILSMTPLGIDLSANKELRIAVTFGIAAVASYFL